MLPYTSLLHLKNSCITIGQMKFYDLYTTRGSRVVRIVGSLFLHGSYLRGSHKSIELFVSPALKIYDSVTVYVLETW